MLISWFYTSWILICARLCDHMCICELALLFLLWNAWYWSNCYQILHDDSWHIDRCFRLGLVFFSFAISVLHICLYGVTICVTQFDDQIVQFHFHIKWLLLILIFCMMIMLEVLNALDFFQNYLNHFCFVLGFSFMMIIYELWNCLWLLLLDTWPCLMILLWSFLGYVNMCLKLHCVEFQLLFWIFSSSLTLGFDLVVCTYMWALNFRTKHPNSMVNGASPFECWYLLLIANICCFVGWW